MTPEQLEAEMALQDRALSGDMGEDARYLEHAARWLDEWGLDSTRDLAERLRAMYRRTRPDT